MLTSTVISNQNTIDTFFKVCKGDEDFRAKAAEGKICLGVKGDRLVVVNYGDSFTSSLIESIKHIFNGVRVNANVEKVFNETKKLHMEILKTEFKSPLQLQFYREVETREAEAVKAKAIEDAKYINQAFAYLKSYFV